MIESKPYSWTAKPESLEAKFKLMCRLPYDPRVKRRHMLVFGFILDWYHSGYGNALASYRHVYDTIRDRDPAGIGLFMGDIHGALTDLVSWGYLDTEPGKGRRASRYMPVWELSVRDSLNTTSVRETPNISVLETPNTTGHSVREIPELRPTYQTRSTDPGTGSDIDIRPGSAAAEGAARAGDGYAALAAAYAKPGDNLHKAGLVYTDLAPDASEQARMVKAATSWKASAKGPRMSLERWLREKRWLGTEEFKQDNRRASRFPSCVVTYIKPVGGEGARIKYRDYSGTLQTRMLDADEMAEFQDYCASDRPQVAMASDDLHEFVGARFHVDAEDGTFGGYLAPDAA